MIALRAAMQGHIDQITPGDPRRIAFGSLHGYSVTVMGVAMVAGLVAFVIMAKGSSPIVRERATSPKRD
jgi:hypothetical protein